MEARRRPLRAVLIAVALTGGACEGGTSSPAASPSVAPTTSAAPGPVELTGLKLEQPSKWTADPSTWIVELSWDVPTDFEVDHYEVARNGLTIVQNVTTNAFADDEAEPGMTYRYRVHGVDAAGAATGSATAALTTGAPPLADARLLGKFIAKLHLTDQDNLKSGASGGGALFAFEPNCKQGACDAKIKIDTSSATLRRHQATYEGTLRAPFHLKSCTGGTIVETLVFELEVTKATSIHHVWRASRLEGTLDESGMASGCLTGHLAYRVTALLRLATGLAG
ncbi:MAG TPA: hypothetical protein VH989_09345 [Actinomycetota bacterium]|jgi:hypothetical protein